MTKLSGLFALIGGVILVILANAPAGPVIGAGALMGTTLAFIVGLVLGIFGLALLILGGDDNAPFKPDARLLKTESDYPCPVCGKQQFTWGMTTGGPRFRTSVVGPIWSGKPILARKCDTCGNLLYFVKDR